MSAIDELELLMQECNTDVIAVIANRLKSMDGLTRTDAIYLSNLAHTEDLNKITDILSKTAEKSKIEVNKAIEEASKENDELAEQFYKAKNLDTTVRSDVLKGIQKRAEKSMIDDILNLSHTAGFYIDGKPTSITKTYTNMINKGIYATQQGTMTYQQAIRNSIKQLADSGLRVVDFESGYSRRLDTQVRMNVLDGVRQMNMEYSTQQGKEFGADGVEVSAHGLCAKDHQMIQGRQYSIDKFKRLNNSLDRAIGTCNCYHRTYPIILGISQPAYSNEELREINRKSNEMVTYTDKFGEEHQCSRYDATQLQRRQETLLRRLKDERNAYQTAGNDAMVKELDRKIKLQTQYYKDVSAEVGLKPRMDRARVVNPHKSATKEVPKVEKFVEENRKFTGNPNSNIAKAMGSDNYDRFLKHLDDNCSDDRVRKMWELFENGIDGDFTHKGGAYCSGLSNKIYVNILKDAQGSDWQAPFQVLCHETGHSIDGKFGKTQGFFWYSSTYKNGIFGQTIKDEIQGLIDRLDKELKTEYKLHKTDIEWLKKNKYWNIWRDVPEKYSKTRAYSLFQKEIRDIPRDARGDISDIIEGATNGRVTAGFGHGASYWKDKSNLSLEAFAEITDATLTNPKNLEQIKKYCPKSYDIYLEMVDNILKEMS